MTQQLKLEIEKRLCYGRYLYYPKCAASKVMCVLMGKKSFTEENMKVLMECSVFDLAVTKS